MKLALAALAIVLVSALICIGVIKISRGKEIESFEIGFHIRLTDKDLLKGGDTHTIKGDPKNWFPGKLRKDERTTIADSVLHHQFRPGQLDNSNDAKDSSMRDYLRKRELYIGEDKPLFDSSEFNKPNEK